MQTATVQYTVLSDLLPAWLCCRSPTFIISSAVTTVGIKKLSTLLFYSQNVENCLHKIFVASVRGCLWLWLCFQALKKWLEEAREEKKKCTYNNVSNMAHGAPQHPFLILQLQNHSIPAELVALSGWECGQENWNCFTSVEMLCKGISISTTSRNRAMQSFMFAKLL